MPSTSWCYYEKIEQFLVEGGGHFLMYFRRDRCGRTVCTLLKPSLMIMSRIKKKNSRHPFKPLTAHSVGNIDLDQWFSTFLVERNPNKTFQRLEEPLCINLILICKKHYLINIMRLTYYVQIYLQ